MDTNQVINETVIIQNVSIYEIYEKCIRWLEKKNKMISSEIVEILEKDIPYIIVAKHALNNDVGVMDQKIITLKLVQITTHKMIIRYLF